MKKIIAAGAALIDYPIAVNDEQLSQIDGAKGGMHLSDPEKIQAHLATLNAQPEGVTGGSSANTIVGLAKMGADCCFLGRIGQDEQGKQFADCMKNSGVEFQGISSESPTGRVLALITPDAQRTMHTFLGAAVELSEKDLSEDFFTGADLLHLEGYLAFNEPFYRTLIQEAKARNIPLSLDLASTETIAVCKKIFEETIDLGLEILIANEDEAEAFTGVNPRESLKILAQKAKVAVVKLGKEGVLVASEGKEYEVPATSVKAIDTTGAGDLWASGFLYGWSQNRPLDQAASLGCVTAGEVVQVIGAQLSEDSWKKIMNFAK